MITIRGRNYLSANEYRAKHKYRALLSVYLQVRAGRIEGAFKDSSGRWWIPEDTIPPDGRITSGKYVGMRPHRKKPFPDDE